MTRVPPLPVPSWWSKLRAFLRPARLQLREDQHDALADALRELGATVSEKEGLVAGAVERTIFDVDLAGRRARIVCDSYEGPLLMGDAALVAAVDERLRRG